MNKNLLLIGLILSVAISGCKKDPKIIGDNDAPYYGDVPTVLVKNYINRLYIDLIGREPLDVEMDADVLLMRDNDLSKETRESIVDRLMTDTSYVEGDSSYFIAYYHRFYDMSKARLLEGVSNSEINGQWGIYHFGWIVDSINGNLIGMAEKEVQMAKLEAILSSEFEYRRGEVDVNDVYVRMLDNYFYDLINMNTFNFVNASFDDLYYRFPTQSEFTTAFDIIEYNSSSVIFGKPAQNKDDYIKIVSDTREYYEGMIIWVYRSFVSRDPTTQEVYDHMQEFYIDRNVQKIQKSIVVTDEYANFK